MTNLPLTGVFSITATFKQINKSLWKTLGFHTGLDFVGNDNIYATCDGIVDEIAYSNAYGNYIIVKEDNVNRYHYFCHLSKVKVKKGDRVSRVTIIGIMGSTGNVTGKHLHYEIRKAQALTEANLINPADYCGIPNKKGAFNSVNYELKGKPNIKYQAHCQNLGWQEEKKNGEWAGTTGQGLRVEALIINADINIQYRVHIQDKGWSDYVPNGCVAGTVGESKRIEAIEIISSKNPIKAQAHIENIGNQKEVTGTHIKIGTEGQALRLEAFRLEFE